MSRIDEGVVAVGRLHFMERIHEGEASACASAVCGEGNGAVTVALRLSFAMHIEGKFIGQQRDHCARTVA